MVYKIFQNTTLAQGLLFKNSKTPMTLSHQELFWRKTD